MSKERVVRIGFQESGEGYLVPLGFVWHERALYAMTTHGRKTRMATVNPKGVLSDRYLGNNRPLQLVQRLRRGNV